MSNGYVYLRMADEDFPRRIAFAFLEDIRQRFENEYKAPLHQRTNAHTHSLTFARTHSPTHSLIRVHEDAKTY